jgi:ribosomal protein S18 acetylase RimI-like enzyme
VQPEDDPAAVLAVYRRAPHVHPYGLADVEQLWATSTWWRRGDAVVGLLDLHGGPVVYAVAAEPAVQAATLDLLADLAPDLPDAFVITGPTGLADRLAAVGHRTVWADAYDKLHLPADVALPPAPEDVEVLGAEDLPDLVALLATDPDAGDFFHAGLLDTGHYLGRRQGGDLVAVAGVHVVDPVNGVAALGNVATHPAHRRRGHGRAVVVALCHRLRAEVAVIGLNVRHRTAAARGLYDRLGFRFAVTYEEAAVARPPGYNSASPRPV